MDTESAIPPIIASPVGYLGRIGLILSLVPWTMVGLICVSKPG